MRRFKIYQFFLLIHITWIGNQTCQSFTRFQCNINSKLYHRSYILLKSDTNVSLKSKDHEHDTQDGNQHLLTQTQKDRIARIKRGPRAYGYQTNKQAPNQKTNKIVKNTKYEKGGVPCTGEPSIDPSRSLQNSAGFDSEWMEDFYFDAK